VDEGDCGGGTQLTLTMTGEEARTALAAGRAVAATMTVQRASGPLRSHASSSSASSNRAREASVRWEEIPCSSAVANARLGAAAAGLPLDHRATTLTGTTRPPLALGGSAGRPHRRALWRLQRGRSRRPGPLLPRSALPRRPGRRRAAAEEAGEAASRSVKACFGGASSTSTRGASRGGGGGSEAFSLRSSPASAACPRQARCTRSVPRRRRVGWGGGAPGLFPPPPPLLSTSLPLFACPPPPPDAAQVIAVPAGSPQIDYAERRAAPRAAGRDVDAAVRRAQFQSNVSRFESLSHHQQQQLLAQQQQQQADAQQTVGQGRRRRQAIDARSRQQQRRIQWRGPRRRRR